MLQWYHDLLIAMAVCTIAVSWRVPRAVLWVSLGAASYVSSAILHNYGVASWLATLYGATTNFVICYALYRFACREGADGAEWEMNVFKIFILMILIDLLFLTGIIHTRWLFAVSLEFMNALAMAVIFATGVTERLAHHGHPVSVHRGGLLDRLHHSLHDKRAPYPKWWKTP